VRDDILELIDNSAPAALSSGLAGALRSLAAVCPIAVSFQAVGDLSAGDPLCLGLYLAVGEALTNAVKHSAASRVDLTLTVATDNARIRLQDNGIGGVTDVPQSISSRVRDLRGDARIESPPNQGTTVLITVPRPVGGVR
jgi:signal transduction histidine kinase